MGTRLERAGLAGYLKCITHTHTGTGTVCELYSSGSVYGGRNLVIVEHPLMGCGCGRCCCGRTGSWMVWILHVRSSWEVVVVSGRRVVGSAGGCNCRRMVSGRRRRVVVVMMVIEGIIEGGRRGNCGHRVMMGRRVEGGRMRCCVMIVMVRRHVIGGDACGRRRLVVACVVRSLVVVLVGVVGVMVVVVVMLRLLMGDSLRGHHMGCIVDGSRSMVMTCWLRVEVAVRMLTGCAGTCCARIH